MVYICDICNKSFKDLAKYKKHINKKTTCDDNVKNKEKEKQLTCGCCKKIFSRKQNFIKHVTICQNENKTTKLENMISTLNEKINELCETAKNQNEKIKKLSKKESVIINTNLNQTQNIYGLNAFGKENLDFITESDYNRIFKKGCRAIQYFVELVHCNENMPENRNVYIGNFKDKYIRTFNGKSWVIENKEDVLHNLFNSKRDFLELKYNDLEESLTKEAKYFFGEKYFENATTTQAIADIKDDIKNILYDNRIYVIKNPNKKIKKKEITKIATDQTYIPDTPMFKFISKKIEKFK